MTGTDVDAPGPDRRDRRGDGTGGPARDDGTGGVAASDGAGDGDGRGRPVATMTEHRFDPATPVVEVLPDGSRRRRRVSKWDRPPPPHDWRWWVGNLGKTLIAVGILMFGFVAYQLWGTGIENAAAQRALEDDFEELLAQFEPVDDPPTTAQVSEAGGALDGGGSTASDASDASEASGTEPVVVPIEQEPALIDPAEVVPASEQNLPPIDDGEAIARLEIPRIGVSDVVVAGIDRNDLKRGPGHFPDTPLPGQLGNSAIAGHRTTYGAPFFEVDQLENGDEIRVTTLNGVFVYRVTGTSIVAPSEYRVVATTDPTTATLTLVSCHPRYTARQRIIISAELDPAASGAVGEPVLNYGRPDEPDVPTELPADADTGQLADADEDGGAPDDPLVADTGDDGDPSAAPSSGSVPDSLDETSTAADDLLGTTVDDASVDVFSEGWFSDPGANPQVGLWGLALTVIAVLSYLLSRRLRRDWVGLTVGIVPFVVALYFFFQNVNRLLPPNL